MSERSFNWEMTVDNIALIYDTGSKQELKSRFDFGNQAAPGEAPVNEQSGHPLPSDFLKTVYEVRERIMRESHGELFEDSSEIIRQMREERTKYLMEILEQSDETE